MEKELSLYHIIQICRILQIFQNMNSVRSNNLSLYQRFTPSGCKYIGIRQPEFVAQTQFLYMNWIWKKSRIFIVSNFWAVNIWMQWYSPGLLLQAENGSPIYPVGQLQIGLWFTTSHLALIPHTPTQGLTHRWFIHARDCWQSELLTHSGRQLGGAP